MYVLHIYHLTNRIYVIELYVLFFHYHLSFFSHICMLILGTMFLVYVHTVLNILLLSNNFFVNTYQINLYHILAFLIMQTHYCI